ncbi:MAG TPA: DNA gyrase inhibitor YacG [Acidocella sp.]|nr:DNA gyrase inhibitor YacG [Acidocella sp.]
MKCPICNKQATPESTPFCSRRCAEIDLGRWLTDSYKLPARTDEEEEDEKE